MTPPTCPLHGPMTLGTITQGEGDDEIYLGKVWWCMEKDCDECEDYHEEFEQLEMFEN